MSDGVQYAKNLTKGSARLVWLMPVSINSNAFSGAILTPLGGIESYMYLHKGHVTSTTTDKIWLELPKQFIATRNLLETLNYEHPRLIIRPSKIHNMSRAPTRRYVYVYHKQ